MKKIIFGLMSVLLLVTSATATNINLLDNVEAVGVYLDNDYYTIILENGKITKIELNGTEEVKYTLKFTSEKILEFLNLYPTLNTLERVRFLLDNFDLPLDLMMKVASAYMKVN